MKKFTFAVCILSAILTLNVVSNACLVQYSVTVKANNDILSFNGQGETGADGLLNCVLVNQETAIGDAFIDSLKIKLNGDPEVGIEFGVRAGSLGTTFDILSDVVSFDPMTNPQAYGSAGVTLTDRGGSAGASIVGLFDGKVHQARYNSTSVFGNLVRGFSISSGTLTNDENKPLSGSEVISGSVSSIESEFYFSLSARDSASGTSTFVVIPEPATMSILALGALALISRKK